MIETIWHFWKRNVRRNFGRVLGTTHPYLSGILALGIVSADFGSNAPLKLVNIATTFITYDTVVFGFTATAIALAIAIPSPTFIRFLSGMKDRTTPFRDFLFILAWNGFIHIAAFFILIPVVIFGSEWQLTDHSKFSLRVYTFFILWSQFYACFQFMVTTLSVYELGDLYANYVAKERSEEEWHTPHN